jgi:hypothetical protein
MCNVHQTGPSSTAHSLLSPFTIAEHNISYQMYNKHYCSFWRSRHSDWLRARGPRGHSSNPSRVKNFLFSTSSRPVLGSTHLPSQRVPGALFPEVKRPKRKADHSHPASAEVKKTQIYTSTPPYAFTP